MDRARIIERSLQCFVAAWFSLIPLLGVAPAVIALRLHRRVRGETGASWNPAARYAAAGFALAWLGLALSLLTIAGAALAVWISLTR